MENINTIPTLFFSFPTILRELFPIPNISENTGANEIDLPLHTVLLLQATGENNDKLKFSIEGTRKQAVGMLFVQAYTKS